MSLLKTVILKELCDNFRDKRSLFFALLYGPLLLPLVMIISLGTGINLNTVSFEKVMTVHMVAPDESPNLVSYLREKQIDIKPAPDDYREKLQQQELVMVLERAEGYEQALRQGQSAAVRMVFNSEYKRSQKASHKLQRILNEYGQLLAGQRLSIRGIDANFIRPVSVVRDDVGLIDGPSKALFGMVPMIILLSFTFGGFYLAVDTSAGEKEQNSLEPLLSLSVPRVILVLGKWVSLLTFVFMSGALAAAMVYVFVTFFPSEEFRSIMSFDGAIYLKVCMLLVPVGVFITAGMYLIGCAAKNIKEAQTHLGIAMIIQMLPYMLMQIGDVKDADHLMHLPILGQFLLIDEISSGQALDIAAASISAIATLACSAVLMWLVVRLYQRDSFLGR